MKARALSLAVAALGLGPGVLLAQEEGGGGLFSIDPGLSIWTVVIFLLLLAGLGKFAWGPLLGALDAREDRIQGQLDDASSAQAEARGLLEEHRQQLRAARREAQEIVARAREAGDQVRREIEEKARDESQRTLESARTEIEREKDAALDAIRREAVDLALAATAKLLDQKVDAERDRALVEGYLARLGGGGGAEA